MIESQQLNDSKSVCVIHADREAITNCQRCGDFICKKCLKRLPKSQVCQRCAKKYLIDAVDTFKARLWGRRDSHVCFLSGFGALLSLIFLAPLAREIYQRSAWGGGTASLDTSSIMLLAIIFGVNTLITVTYFMLKKWARWALFLIPLLCLVAPIALFLLNTNLGMDYLSFSSIVSVLTFIAVLSALLNPRTKLAFKIEISKKQLQTLYDRSKINREARNSVAVALLGLLVPPLLFASLFFAYIGLKKYDPDGWPPVEGIKQAQVGLAISLLGLLFWAIAISYMFIQSL
ncbi:MAG: hypothetical protein P1V97_01760 [Planctomycetota bacterium]|nr:hypothetical protein [Planctomycetota bacterium]